MKKQNTPQRPKREFSPVVQPTVKAEVKRLARELSTTKAQALKALSRRIGT